MAETVYTVNEVAKLTAAFTVGGVATDPTEVIFVTRDPAGTVTTDKYSLSQVTKDSTGNYHINVTVTVPGTWYYSYQGTGAVVDEGQSYFFVKPDFTAARTNTLATLQWDLATALRDTAFKVWTSQEMANILTQAAAGAWPHLSRELDPSLAGQQITLVSGTYFYALPAGMISLSRVDYIDGNGNEMGPLKPGSWFTEGDLLAGAKLHVSPGVVLSGGTLRLLGYARYDLATNLVPDDYVPLLLAMAREQAYRRALGNRSQTTVFLANAQQQNITVNEIVLLLNDAKQEVQLERNRVRKWQRPVPARHG